MGDHSPAGSNKFIHIGTIGRRVAWQRRKASADSSVMWGIDQLGIMNSFPFQGDGKRGGALCAVG